jgi:hypothetical protein
VNRNDSQNVLTWARLVNQFLANSPKIKYNDPEVYFLLQIYDDYPSSFKYAFAFLYKSQVTGNNTDSIIGINLASEFLTRKFTAKRKKNESEKHLITSSKNDFDILIKELQLEVDDFIANEKLKLESIIKNKFIDIEKSYNDFEDWKIAAISNHNEFSDDSKAKIASLEYAYDQLLSLKKPADYWKQRAQEMKEMGNKYLCYLYSAITVISAMLFILLWISPETIFVSFFSSDKSTSIRWSIIFISFISISVYGIRVLTRMVFSSFHLSRDAEERERLTYVYLSMIKEGSIETSERNLIMQSIFSRADTGLLKEDSSPTMPGIGNIANQITR